MTATDELRRLLDERGVEWRGGLPTETMVEADGLDLLYVALPDGRVRAFIRNYLTPEQAIAATLAYIEAEREVDRLQAENAKLRELVRDMWFWHYEGHIDSESQERQMKHIDRVIDCMRELGVDA